MERWDRYMTERAQKNFQATQLEECEDNTSRRDALLNGNQITTQITNFGSISAPGNRISDIVWNGLGYGFEFGPFVAAEIEIRIGRTHKAFRNATTTATSLPMRTVIPSG